MEFIRFDSDCADLSFAGNKAARLAMLRNEGFRVPPFFVVGPHASHEVCRAALSSEIACAITRLSKKPEPVAVRSSSREEDGEETSFAGQFHSFLNVDVTDVTDHVFRVWHSASGTAIDAYRQANGVTGAPPVPAVLVQCMINADAAGVAFAADPVSGDPDTAVIAAVAGTAECLVNGDVDGQTWQVDRGWRIAGETHGAVLSKRQVRAVAQLVRRVSDYFGKPQDIEWAIRGGRLYLLQSRDITTLAAARPVTDYALWDNSNIVESYGGVTRPLTFSVARFAYQEAYRRLGRALGISERVIHENRRVYEQMIGLVQGRVYYNLLNWYRLLAQTPGFRFNRRFMEQMMGVSEGLPADALPASSKSPGWRGKLDLVPVGLRLAWRLAAHSRRVARFHRELDDALAEVDLSTMSLAELIDYYDALQARVIPAWDTPLFNDLYCMMFHGALRALCERWLDDELAGIHNELVRDAAGIVSLEPVRMMREMASRVAAQPGLAETLRSGSRRDIERCLATNARLRADLDGYTARFGDRCLDELKLESPTVADDPLPLLRSVGQLAVPGARGTEAAPQEDEASKRLREALAGRPVRRWILERTLDLARARIRDRENLRFERTRVYGRLRALFVEAGRRLESLGVLRAANDVFLMTADEITGLARGTGCSVDFAPVVEARRAEFRRYTKAGDPPRRFTTVGPAQLASSMQPVADSPVDCSAALSGQACSPGIVRGPVRVVRDPHTAEVREGEILVAERTDPGWVLIFPLVSGMIMERGSLLSHSAIVAREMRIPAVVGVDDACRRLADGDWVELNGATGVIRRLEETERAA